MEDVKAKQVEMCKWFKLPVDCSVVDRLDMSDAIGIDLHEALSSHHAEKVEIAINSYDKHVELITKQDEPIKMLREALKKCIACSYNLDFEAGWMTSGLEAADEALSATEQE